MSKVHNLLLNTSNTELHSSFVIESSDTFVAILNANFITTLPEFYTAISKALNFPDYFGENLDALDEMLYDLDWLPHQYVLLLITNSASFLQHDEIKKEDLLHLMADIDNPFFEVAFL